MSYITIFAQAPAATEAAAAATTTPAQASAAQATTMQPASNDATSAAPQEGSAWGTFMTFGLVIVIFYFLLIRPQQKQQKELKARQEALKAGDKVVTAGGIYGIVREVQEKAVKLEIAANTIIKIDKGSIVRSVSKEGN